MKITPLQLTPFAALLLTLPLSAQEAAVPEFSKGMPDVKLGRKMTIDGQKAYRLTTALDSKGFSTTLAKVLGTGWRKRALTEDETFSVTAARTSAAECSLEVYENEKLPGIEIRASYSKEKKDDAHADVDVQVFRSKEGNGRNDDFPARRLGHFALHLTANM
jgi:hypothetical protein